MTRTVVIMPQAVARNWYHRPWSEVLAAAEAGIDGLSVAEQPRSGDGANAAWDIPWAQHSRRFAGCAVFYRSLEHKPDTCALHVQNY